MTPKRLFAVLTAVLATAAAGLPAMAQESRSAAQAAQAEMQTRLQQQRQAMQALAMMDGQWRGPAWFLAPDGQRQYELTQTERAGPFLDGAVKVVEGRGYGPDGRVTFNAFAVISFNPATGRYGMRSYAQGQEADATVDPMPDGLRWAIPTAHIRYTITIKDGVWHEIGERAPPGQPVVKFLEMRLQRIGSSDWPAAGAVPMR